jgi:uncharacterized membrane protein YfcA
MTWELSLCGLLIGVLVGLTGMGGGSLLTPILVLVFGFKPVVAIGTDILHGAIFKTFGAARHRRLGNVQGRLSGWMFLGSAPASLVGVALAAWLRNRYGDGVESIQGQVLGIALIFGATGVFLKTLVRPRPARDPFILARRDRIAAVAIGLFGGFVVGLTSVGSGTFFALTMLVAFSLRSVKVVGTDIFHAAALLWVAGLGHLAIGNVDGRAVMWLLLGSVPGILIGSQYTAQVPDRALRLGLATILAVSGTEIAELPGAVAVTVIVLAVAAGISLMALRLVRRVPAPEPVPRTADTAEPVSGA